MRKIKVLIVDDSVLFRSQIQLALKDCDQLDIVGTAANGKIALEKIVTFDVDLVILDVEMPVMDGIETVKEIRKRNLKSKVIMFSSMSRSGAERTLDAMKLGALDFVAKPTPDQSDLSPDQKIRQSLLPKILSLYPEVPPLSAAKVVKSGDIVWETFCPDVLVIASSTGGPGALEELFGELKEPIPFPILIAQHMPEVFTATLAERLGNISGKVSGEGKHGEVLQPNQIYVAPGNYHMSIDGTKDKPFLILDQRPHRNYVRPCADFLLESAAKIFRRNTLGIVLTGMGRDGADGSNYIKQVGGAVLIQSKESCVVFGMPGAVFDEGNFHFMGTPAQIGMKIKTLIKAHRKNYVA